MTLIAALPNPASPLDHATAEQAFADILDGRVAEREVAEFLTGLAVRGETIIEVAAAARALRGRMVPVTAPVNAIDVCGTGGDGADTLNVSTAVAIVVAACGVPVAKHGNRAATSRSGAADVLEAVGLNLARAAATAEAGLEAIGIAFLFAQAHHPALARLASVGRASGRRTVFNIVGPLCNPARVRRQLVGVARVDRLGIVSGALATLGSEAALVVAGEEGLDELSVAGASRAEAVGACPFLAHVVPEDAGLARHPAAALRGGDPAYNAAALAALLEGAGGAYRAAVLLNAAAALLVAGCAADLQEGAAVAAEAIDDGRARRLLAAWIAF